MKKNIAVQDIIELASRQPQQDGLKEKDFEKFSSLYRAFSESGKADSYAVFSAQHQLLSSCVFFFSHARAYYILVGNHPDGRTVGASHALIDTFIQEHAEKDMTLDFEGSDISNLAFFYSSFGAIEESYPALRLNRLPWYIKWLKK